MTLAQINNTTFRPVPGGDVRALITLGGEKDPDKFAPNLNIGYSFGGGEEYFENINRTDKIITGKSEIKYDGEKARLIEGSDIDEIYVDELGRTKWDVVFEKCPESMVIEWQRKCSPGLTAYYQPALTEDEIKEGSYRPPDVVGSYAIYCDKAHNWIRPLDRKKEIPADWRAQIAAGAALGDVNISAYRDYKTGKVGHKYRPFVIDADGKTEWCTLLIVGTVERVTLPEEFMRTAKYPVRLDPTFGYTTKGASEYNPDAGYFYGVRLTSASEGSATSLVFYVKSTNSSRTWSYGLYEYDDDSLVAYSSEGSGEVDGWSSLSITASDISEQDYWLLVQSDAVSGFYIYYDSVDRGTYGVRTYSSTWGALSISQKSNFRLSGYVNYTESGGSSLAIYRHHYEQQGMM